MLFRIFHRQSSVESMAKPRELIEEMPPKFKEYRRFPRIPLHQPKPITDSFQSLIDGRVSERDYTISKSVSLDDISTILAVGPGLNKSRENKKEEIPLPRHHPSGGALYPLECYLAAFRVEGLSVGIYHYAPQEHALEHLIISKAPENIREACKGLIPDSNPAAALIITGVWGRNYPKYGELAYRLTLIEAGHMMQDMLLAARSRAVKSFPLVGFRQQVIAEELDILSDIEDPLYMGFLGK